MEEDLDTLEFQHKVVLGKEKVAPDAGTCDAALSWLWAGDVDAVLLYRARSGCWAQQRSQEERVSIWVGILMFGPPAACRGSSSVHGMQLCDTHRNALTFPME